MVLHDEIVLTLKGKKDEKVYKLRKSDVAKAIELAGVSGNIEGKIYLPAENGTKVKKGDSVADMIKESWSVPVHIPYASELKVEDGAPVTQVVKSDSKDSKRFICCNC